MRCALVLPFAAICLAAFCLAAICLAPTGASADGNHHVVAAGESLSSLAELYHVPVERIRELNELESDTIRVGQELTVEPEPTLRYRTVPGDTLGCIASRFGVPLERVLEDNPGVSAGRLAVGIRLELRGGVDPREEDASADEGTPSTAHVVSAGETLSSIAARYGVSVRDIEAQNGGVDPARLAVGAELQVPAGAPLVVHSVTRGENLSRIAALYGVEVDALRALNPGVRPARLQVGQALTVPRGAARSESVGAANCGFVRGSVGLGEHAAYVLRNPARSWATGTTVQRIRRGFDRMARTYPSGPRVRVHDLGLRGGGPIDDHRSHQSGRDVDITYYQRRGCSGREGCPLRRLDPDDLDVRRQWTLLREWLRRDEVEAIYIDYALQAPLHREARRRGASAAQLNAWFQYPRGRWHSEGRVRHFPNHRDHLHVRFACDRGERACR